MMRNKSVLLSLLLVSMTLTGCFEIREEVNLKVDGSGEVVLVFDLSKSKTKLKQYMTLEKVDKYRVPSESEIESFLLQVKMALRGMAGITYADTKADWSSFIFQVTARFDNITALNKAIADLSAQLKHLEMPAVTGANFLYEKGRFSRQFDLPKKANEYAQLPASERFMLETSHAISIYRFEKAVREISHKKAVVSPSGKAVMLKVPLSELVTGAGTLANTIRFVD